VRRTNRGVVPAPPTTDDLIGMPLASLIAPFATLAVLWLAGLGIASLVASRAPLDAQTALAPLVAAAIVFISSPIVLAGLPPLAAVAAVLGSAALVSVARRRHSLRLARRAAIPAAIACLAIGLAGIPALKHQTWAAGTPGNLDAYVWVSQARSLEDGPPRGAVATTPDRVAYDLLEHRHWPTAIPGGLAELAAVEGVDPVQAYGVFAVVIVALLALATFFGARGCLHWSSRRSAVAAGLVTANGLVLLSSFYGWQAQILLTTAGTLFVLTVPQCFDRRARARDCVAPSLFAASAIALYGWTMAPFIVIAGAVSLACRRRGSAAEWTGRRFFGRLGTIGALTCAFGCVAIARAAVTLVDGSQHASAVQLGFWNQYAWAYPSDALGLVPRGPRDVPGAAWEVLAMTVAAVLLGMGIRSARSFRNPRGFVLIAAGGAIVAELAALALSGSSPYVSLKLMAYSTPLLTLLALGPRLHTSPGTDTRTVAVRGRVLGVAIADLMAVCLFAATTGSAVSIGVHRTHTATQVRAAARAAEALPPRKVILLDVGNGWNQVWLAYFLRDRPIALRQPSIVFTGYSAADEAHAQAFTTPADFAIRKRVGRPSVWRGKSLAIYPTARSGSA
jgi:hypothetical protein